jgi:hypothetical protein
LVPLSKKDTENPAAALVQFFLKESLSANSFTLSVVYEMEPF